ncbi:hypothetical protein B0H14DRAFT_2641630 [Mycena olivaceomarginata]|nr:hypothetical protein B0H14DRAFT_2641630 [Mycena olivaceomarginata]
MRDVFVGPRIVAVPHLRLSEIPSAEGGHWFEAQRAHPLLARGRVIAAGAGDGKPPRGVLRMGGGRYGAEDGRGKRGGYGAMGGQLQCVLHAGGMVAHRVRGAQQAEVWSGGHGRRGDGRGARGSDEGGVGARGTCCALRRCCASYCWCRTGAGFERRIVLRTRGGGACRVEDAPGARVDRESGTGDALGARGGDKKRRLRWGTTIARAAHTGDGEGGAGEYGRRRRRAVTAARGDVGGKERQRRVLRVQLVVRVGLGFAPAVVSSMWAWQERVRKAERKGGGGRRPAMEVWKEAVEASEATDSLRSLLEYNLAKIEHQLFTKPL